MAAMTDIANNATEEAWKTHQSDGSLELDGENCTSNASLGILPAL